VTARCTAIFGTMGLAFLGSSGAVAQQSTAALDRTLLKTHMRQETAFIAIADALVQAFPPTTIQCGDHTCTIRTEVSAQFFKVTSGNAVRFHVSVDDVPFPITGFEIDGGINRPTAHLTTVTALTTDLGPGPHVISVGFDMRTPGGQAQVAIRTLTIQVFRP
jgi:hypothetical protein